MTSHRAAAGVWALASTAKRIHELSIPSERRIELPGVTIHRTQDLESVDVVVHRAIPVTTPARTLIDLAAVVPEDILEEGLDDALRRGLTSFGRLERRLCALGRRGRPGVATIRALLARRGGATPESPLETRFLRRLRTAGLPLPVPQYEIRHGGRFVARSDFAYPDLKLAIEVDSYEHHASRARFERDRKRLNALTELGWRVVHVTWAQLCNESDELIRLIAALVGERRQKARRA